MSELRKSSNYSNSKSCFPRDFDESSCEVRRVILRVSIPDRKLERILEINNNDLIWDAKLRILQSEDMCLREPLNYGFFMPPRNGKCGKFLDEWRPADHYAFESPMEYVEFVRKKRLYKNVGVNDMKIKKLRSKAYAVEFFNFIKNQNLEEIVKLLNKGFDPNCQDPDSKETPLTMSVKYSNCENLVAELYHGGAHLDFRNSNSLTPLHEAVRSHNINAVKALLNLGMSPKVRDGDNFTPLYYAVSLNCPIDMIKLLLYDHSPVGCVNMENGLSELHLACMRCHVSTVDLLLFYGADFNLKSRSGDNCLHICARLNKADSARCLLVRGINPNIPNENGKTALDIAIMYDNSATALVIRDFDRRNINPHCQVPTRNDRRRSNLCEPRISLSHNDLSRQGRSSVTSAFSSLLSRIKNKKPKIIGSLMSGSQLLTNYRNNFEPQPARSFNIRTLYIVRNKKPFGFILRGPKKRKTQDELNSMGDAFPSYHFIESVEKGSVAEKAGLCVNDFILEIDNRDVRCLSHSDVVSIIRKCGQEITFKIGTRSKTVNPVQATNDASLLLKSKLSSLSIIPNSTGTSLRATPKNDITQITKLFGDDSDSEEKQHNVEVELRLHKSSIEDPIVPPPAEFCDNLNIEDPHSTHENQLRSAENKKIESQPYTPLPPLRTTSMQASVNSSKSISQRAPGFTATHLDELQAVLKKRSQDGDFIVKKIEQKQEPRWNFDIHAVKPPLLDNFPAKYKPETHNIVPNKPETHNTVPNKPEIRNTVPNSQPLLQESKQKLYHHDSGIEVVSGYTNVVNKDLCWMFDLQNSKASKVSSKSDKKVVGRHTMF